MCVHTHRCHKGAAQAHVGFKTTGEMMTCFIHIFIIFLNGGHGKHSDVCVCVCGAQSVHLYTEGSGLLCITVARDTNPNPQNQTEECKHGFTAVIKTTEQHDPRVSVLRSENRWPIQDDVFTKTHERKRSHCCGRVTESISSLSIGSIKVIMNGFWRIHWLIPLSHKTLPFTFFVTVNPRDYNWQV